MLNRRFVITIAWVLAALAFSFRAVRMRTVRAASTGANRTFVSTAGSDTNTSTDCGPTTPCRTFSAALSVTNSGGELVVLTSGGYGAFTITQPVTITAIGVDASITVTSGDGIDINTTGNVTINGLGIHGQGNDTGSGINVSNVGFLRLYNVTVENFFSEGINFVPSSSGNLRIYDSQFSDSGGGVFIDTTGNIYIKDAHADHNGNGFVAMQGNAVIEESEALSNNAYGFAIQGGSLSLIRDEATQNGIGIGALGGSTQFTYCNIAKNTADAIDIEGGGTITGSNPGTSIVSGGTSGSLGTAATLK